MLQQLSIRNIALIDRVSVAFCEGLHVLTGETGAGKSIVVDAMSLLLGGRADKELIRRDCERAYVEGVFCVSDCAAVAPILDELALTPEDDTLVLSREITRAGRSACRVNGVLVQLAAYKRIASCLMDLHGQHEHQALMDEHAHMVFLDRFGDKAHQALLAQTKAAYEAYHEAQKAYRACCDENAHREERVDMLRYQHKELKDAKLVSGEDDALRKERDLLRNGEKIGDSVRRAYQALYDAPGGGQTALYAVKEALNAMEGIAEYNQAYGALCERLRNLYFELEDAGLTLRDMNDSVADDPDRLSQVEERLDRIKKLSRKYGATVDDMLKKLADIKRELDAYQNLDERLEQLDKRAQKLKKEYRAAAEALSQSRKQLGVTFSQRMERELADLNMAGTRFVAKVETDRESAAASGQDTVSFLIAPNVGEELKSLAKIASGGELSRLMLAIKTIAASCDGVSSMVFDEIDSGISGRAAQVVAQKMADIAKYRQVICVTHLQQIAAMAQRQYLVEKAEADGRTVTSVTLLSDAQRVDELSRMLGGVTAGGESARAHAAEMLAQARAYKSAQK